MKEGLKSSIVSDNKRNTEKKKRNIKKVELLFSGTYDSRGNPEKESVFPEPQSNSWEQDILQTGGFEHPYVSANLEREEGKGRKKGEEKEESYRQ